MKNKKEVTKCEVNVCNEKCKMKRGSKKTLRVEHFRCKLFLMLFLPNSFKKFNFRDLKGRLKELSCKKPLKCYHIFKWKELKLWGKIDFFITEYKQVFVRLLLLDGNTARHLKRKIHKTDWDHKQETTWNDQTLKKYFASVSWC